MQLEDTICFQNNEYIYVSIDICVLQIIVNNSQRYFTIKNCRIWLVDIGYCLSVHRKNIVLKNDACSRSRKPRITGGEMADLHSWPWIVSFRDWKSAEHLIQKHFCLVYRQFL